MSIRKMTSRGWAANFQNGSAEAWVTSAPDRDKKQTQQHDNMTTSWKQNTCTYPKIATLENENKTERETESPKFPRLSSSKTCGARGPPVPLRNTGTPAL